MFIYQSALSDEGTKGHKMQLDHLRKRLGLYHRTGQIHIKDTSTLVQHDPK